MSTVINAPCIIPIASFDPNGTISPSAPVSPLPVPVNPTPQQTNSSTFQTQGPVGIQIGSLVYLDSSGHAALSDQNYTNDVVGVVTNYDSSSGTYTMINSGVTTNSTWNLTVGSSYFLGIDGALTSIPPNTPGQLLQFIGYAVSPVALLLEIQRGIVL